MLSLREKRRVSARRALSTRSRMLVSFYLFCSFWHLAGIVRLTRRTVGSVDPILRWGQLPASSFQLPAPSSQLSWGTVRIENFAQKCDKANGSLAAIYENVRTVCPSLESGIYLRSRNGSSHVQRWAQMSVTTGSGGRGAVHYAAAKTLWASWSAGIFRAWPKSTFAAWPQACGLSGILIVLWLN